MNVVIALLGTRFPLFISLAMLFAFAYNQANDNPQTFGSSSSKFYIEFFINFFVPGAWSVFSQHFQMFSTRCIADFHFLLFPLADNKLTNVLLHIYIAI